MKTTLTLFSLLVFAAVADDHNEVNELLDLLWSFWISWFELTIWFLTSQYFSRHFFDVTQFRAAEWVNEHAWFSSQKKNMLTIARRINPSYVNFTLTTARAEHATRQSRSMVWHQDGRGRTTYWVAWQPSSRRALLSMTRQMSCSFHLIQQSR